MWAPNKLKIKRTKKIIEEDMIKKSADFAFAEQLCIKNDLYTS